MVAVAIRRERRGPGRLHGKSVSCPTGLVLLKSIYIRDGMISNEDTPEVQEWFRSLRPDEIMQFVNALSKNNQRWITHIAQQNTTRQQKKHELWERAFDRNQNRV